MVDAVIPVMAQSVDHERYCHRDDPTDEQRHYIHHSRLSIELAWREERHDQCEDGKQQTTSRNDALSDRTTEHVERTRVIFTFEYQLEIAKEEQHVTNQVDDNGQTNCGQI